MALKILKQIGTNKGITSNAYLRIYNYQISKGGYLQLSVQMFQSAEDANVPFDQVVAGMECFNVDIQNMFKIPLVKKLTKIVKKMVEVDEERELQIPIMDENGTYTNEFRTEKTTIKVAKEMEVEEEYNVPDLSLLDGKDIFAFGYDHLKAKLSETFGSENVVDC